MTDPPLGSSSAIDVELTALARATWLGAIVLNVRATGLWYIEGGPRTSGTTAGFLEIGRGRAEAVRRLMDLIAAHQREGTPESELRLTAEELRSQLPGARL